MPKIHPFLWFDTEAEEAMNFYCSVLRTPRRAASPATPTPYRAWAAR